MTPNPNTSSKLSPAELIFARKIRSIFHRLLPRPRKKIPQKVNFNTNIYKPGAIGFLGVNELERDTGGWYVYQENWKNDLHN